MLIQINDDFDIKKIADSGQCFRMQQLPNGKYRAISGNEVAYIEEAAEGGWNFECTQTAYDCVWYDYFDLGRNYAAIRNGVPDTDPFMRHAGAFGKGIRILRQDAWESLVTFIISQRKSIPAIKKAVEILAVRYGRKITTPYEEVYTFPRASDMAHVSVEDFKACGLGYRASYVADAVNKVLTRQVDLEALNTMSNADILEALKRTHGVGDKVANCVLLFGYGRVDCAPVDVWILRAIEDYYHGVSPFENYGPTAGVLQQYMFYYIRNLK